MENFAENFLTHHSHKLIITGNFSPRPRGLQCYQVILDLQVMSHFPVLNSIHSVILNNEYRCILANNSLFKHSLAATMMVHNNGSLGHSAELFGIHTLQAAWHRFSLNIGGFLLFIKWDKNMHNYHSNSSLQKTCFPFHKCVDNSNCGSTFQEKSC